MTRVKRGITSHKRHKKILKQASGFYSSRSRNFKVAKQAVIKSGQYSYCHRKLKKRLFRRLWILRINAFLKKKNLSYSKFIYLLKQHKIQINRKLLSNFAISNTNSFDLLIKKINL